MNPKYFKDKIYVELNESCEYMKKCIDSLKINPNWSEIFKRMSDDRYNHAVELYKIFMDIYVGSNDQGTYLNSLRDMIVGMFADKTRLIDGYKATYDLVTGSSEPHDEETDNGDNTN